MNESNWLFFNISMTKTRINVCACVNQTLRE